MSADTSENETLRRATDVQSAQSSIIETLVQSMQTQPSGELKCRLVAHKLDSHHAAHSEHACRSHADDDITGRRRFTRK